MTDGRPRTSFLGIDYDPLTLTEVAAQLDARPVTAPFAYLVTPNVDHVVRLHDDHGADRETIWAAYRGARWCTCDSRILAALARPQGIDLPVAAGSDLTALILETLCRPGDRIAVIGGSESTVIALAKRFPDLDIVQHSPPMGLRHDPVAMAAAARFATDARARFTFLAIGSPQQELLAALIAQSDGATGIGLCIGAAIEFVVGESKRAPRVLQRLHLEWAFRLASNPRRLWKRYLVTGPRIFRLARQHRKATPGA
ncbi:glycosyl transferase [Sphingomonas sp. Leaf339]|uniref:WecB/TagA/CpsF family glycosyltransferase n=1 Tax=Sphingomonas sp. Leaf339 TaxID=1736343 RepID=UPI0006F5E3E1|nr:WecB/TagA/CpsF family glycosyltransferase [Sphingomonas sp. Leaf339]KQU62034.1 glycosyl transferase [Sphingomonas sp. Leaf339]